MRDSGRDSVGKLLVGWLEAASQDCLKKALVLEMTVEVVYTIVTSSGIGWSRCDGD